MTTMADKRILLITGGPQHSSNNQLAPFES